MNGLYLTVVFFLGSTYSCVAIAVERYLGICFSQSSWNVRKSRYYVVAICMTTIIIDGPRYYTKAELFQVSIFFMAHSQRAEARCYPKKKDGWVLTSDSKNLG